MTEKEKSLARQIGAKAKVIAKCSTLEADKGKTKNEIKELYAVKSADGKMDYAATLEKLLAHIKENNIKEKRKEENDKEEKDKEEKDVKVFDLHNLGIATSINGKYYVLSKKVFDWIDEIFDMFKDGNGEENLNKIKSKIGGFKDEVERVKQMVKLQDEIEKHNRLIAEFRAQINELKQEAAKQTAEQTSDQTTEQATEQTPKAD